MRRKHILLLLFILLYPLDMLTGRTSEQQAFIRSLELSAEEMEWIQHDYLVRTHSDYWPPYNFYNCQSQIATGITVEFLNWVALHTGIRFEYAKTHLPLHYVLDELKDKKLDFSASLHHTEDRARYLSYTLPIFHVQGGVFALKKQLEGQPDLETAELTIAVEKSSKTHQYLQEYYPNLTLVPVATEEEGLSLVLSQRADCHAGIVDVCKYMIERNPSYSKISLLTSIPDFTPGIYMTARNDWPELTSIVDKALDKMPHDVRQEIINDFTHHIEWSKYKQHMQYAGIIILLLLLTIIVLMLNHIRKYKHAHKQLLEEKRKVDEANHAKSTFIARVSHEIRNPLTIISGMLSELGKSELNNKQTQQLRKIDAANSLLVNLIQDLLDFSVMEKTAITMRCQPFMLKKTIIEIEEMTKSMIMDKNITFHTGIQQDVPEWICGDNQRLKQVLINLITNATKFTKKGSITLSIKRSTCTPTDTVSNKAVLLHFTIKDTGVGISKENLQEIFNPFFQVQHNPSSLSKEGVGLGLTICKKMVSLWGGDIHVSSAPGFGSSFSFTLPCEATTEVRNIYQSNAANKEGRPTACKRILLAEDNLIIQEIVINMLSELGIKTDIAGTGTEAFKAVSANAYDLVLMDINMPGEDGISATRRIREELGNQRIPIVALTAHSLLENKEICMQAGMSDYITKPFSIQTLQQVLEKWIPFLSFEPTEDGQITQECAQDSRINQSITDINCEKLHVYLGNDLPSIKKHIQSFQALCAKRIVEFEEILPSEKGLHAFRLLTHNIKGESGFLGLTSFHSLCLDILANITVDNMETYKAKMLDALQKLKEREYSTSDLC